ncbi:MAG TPA: ABC transporter permease [Chitinophagaceae bacterium]
MSAGQPACPVGRAGFREELGGLMFKNYFKTAFRNLWRNKFFSVINVLGLSIGISASLIIFLIVQFELSYDKVETNADRIYRVVMDMKFNGDDGHSAAVPAPLASAVQREITGIESTVPVMQFQGDATARVSIEKEGSSKPAVFKKQANIVFTNPQYFSLLPFKWIAGSPESSLKNPFNVVLSESRVKQYFPSANINDVIGKQIRYNDDFSAIVSGVVQDLDEHTSFDAVEFISFATIAQTHMQDDFMMNLWNDWMAYSHLYIKISNNTKNANIEAQLNRLFVKYNKNAGKDAANYIHLHLQPLNDVHFNSLYASFDGRIAHKPTLYSLLAVAAFLLILACINFINLTTANAASRAKEIGIRKTMGSSKKQLIFQFLGETFLYTVTACIISFCIAPLLLKMFTDFIPPGLNFQPFNQLSIFLFLLLLAIVVSFLSGLYPAFILSGYNPVKVLKNRSYNFSNETRHAWIRKSLTVSQFVIAQFFVIATVMVSKQINYSLNADMGFRKDAILSFDLPRQDTVANHRTVLLNEIKAIPGVQMASRGFLTPADEGAAFTDIKYEGSDYKESVQLRWGDSNYLKLFNIKILAGRNVEASDTIKEFLINETYAKALSFEHPQDAINKFLDFNEMKLPIVGVMHDFNEQSFHSPVGPLVFASFDNRSYFIHVLLKPQNGTNSSWSGTIAQIQKAYHQFYPDEDFTYNFLDKKIAKFYESEQHTASLLSWATGLSVLISCLGLLGLVIYTINTRTKEIGIRKILGATVTNILSILSKDFVQLVLIAFVITTPVAWWATYKWLQNFAFKINMSWWIFALCGFAMLLIALITLSIQTIKAALANPVKSLRTE